MFPLIARVPSWVPGTGWKKTARKWRELKDSVMEEGYQWSTEQIVRFFVARFEGSANICYFFRYTKAKGKAESSVMRSALEGYILEGKPISDKEKEDIKQIGISLYGG